MIDFVLAGLVIGVVVFTLIVNHRKPDETEFIKQFELAREKSQPAPMQTANAQTAVLRLRRRDFRGAYTGRVDLANFNGDIEIDADLGEVSIKSDLFIDGNLRIAAGTNLKVHGEINCAAGIYVAGILQAERSIETGQSIHCGDSIIAGGSIFATGTIGCGRSIEAAGSIMARDNIRAGVEVKANGAIHAGGTIEAPIVRAGRPDDPRTITCSRLLRGRVNLGELVETGDRRA